MSALLPRRVVWPHLRGGLVRRADLLIVRRAFSPVLLQIACHHRERFLFGSVKIKSNGRGRPVLHFDRRSETLIDRIKQKLVRDEVFGWTQAEFFEDPMAETAFAALLFRRLARF